jgi:hypothetical protein
MEQRAKSIESINIDNIYTPCPMPHALCALHN